jgi:hypothetical protein
VIILKVSNGNREIVLSTSESATWDKIDSQGTTLFKSSIEKFLNDRQAQYDSQDDRDIIADIDSMPPADRAQTLQDIGNRRRGRRRGRN